MLYEYICEDCKNIEEINMPMKADHPKTVICTKCGNDCYRNFLSSSVVIPDNMRAENDGFNYEKSGQIHGKKYY